MAKPIAVVLDPKICGSWIKSRAWSRIRKWFRTCFSGAGPAFGCGTELRSVVDPAGGGAGAGEQSIIQIVGWCLGERALYQPYNQVTKCTINS